MLTHTAHAVCRHKSLMLNMFYFYYGSTKLWASIGVIRCYSRRLFLCTLASFITTNISACEECWQIGLVIRLCIGS